MSPHDPSLYPNYILPPTSDREARLAQRIVEDDKTVTDSSGANNKSKWEFAISVFDCGDCTLFSHIPYELIYESDDPMKCDAGSCVADLRAQYLSEILEANPTDLEAHALYVKNKQWYGKLRERVSLEKMRVVTKAIPLT